MARPKIRLRTLLALLVLATTAPLGVFAGWLIVTSWQEQRAVVERQNVENARAISVAIDQEVENTISALSVLASLDVLDTPDRVAFQELAIRLLPAHAGWHAVLLVEPSGHVLVNTAARLSAPGTLLVDDWVQYVRTTGRPAVSSVVEDRAMRRHFVIIGVPVVRDGALKLVLGAQIRATSLGEVLRRQNAPRNGVVTLLDNTQRILARTRNEDQYIGQPPTADFRDMSRQADEGSWRTTLLEGTAAYAAWSRSRRTGWTVGLGRPAEEVDGPIQGAVRALSAVGVAIMGIGLVAALLVGRRLVVALNAASGAAQALAQGHPVLAAPSRIVELEALSGALRDAAAILNRRLEERDLAEHARAQAAEERERALLAERTAETAREREEARLAVTLRSIGDAVLATDAAGNVTLLNPVAQALLGWTEADALGQPLEAVFPIVNEHTRQRVESPVAKVLREGRIEGMANHTLLLTRDGREIPIADSAAPIYGADGALFGVVLVFRDVTEQRAAERQRAELLEQEQAARRAAEVLNRDKDEFVATISHELRSPLHAILGWVRLLQSGKLEPTAQAHAVEVIDRNTRAQAKLIEDLLDTSRALTGKVRLAMRRLDLAPVLQAAVDTVRPTADAKEQVLVLSTEQTAGLVMGDPDRLQQIAWNLLANAIKFTPKGGRIEARLWGEGSDVILQVRDTGPGIPPDLLPHIFDRFRRGRSPDAEPREGLGIGLSLVRHLVELHGGRVTAESADDGQGAVFTVYLPGLGERAGAVAHLPAYSADSVAIGLAGLDGVSVLVVDDDADARDVLCTMLGQAGAHVLEAQSVQNALERLETAAPDVVLTDIGMPNGSGYDLLRQVRANPRTTRIPVVAVTAYNRVEDRERAVAAGFDLYVGKPVEPAALVRAVAEVAARRATSDAARDSAT